MLKSRESVCWHVDTFSVQGRKSDCLVSFGNTSQRSMCASEYFSLIMRIFSEFTRSTLVSPGVALTYDQKLNSFTVCADESFIFSARKVKKKKITVCVNYLTRSSMTHFLCEVTASVSSQLTEGRTRARGKCRTHRQHSASSGRTYVGTHWRIKIDPRSNTRWTEVLGTGGGRPGCRWNQLSGCLGSNVFKIAI